ncbi:MAG: amidase domain-containing protein [Clostridiaceae bacterium]|nr:amidase domain-containing protein [Clostridiaceae bacterium]
MIYILKVRKTTLIAFFITIVLIITSIMLYKFIFTRVYTVAGSSIIPEDEVAVLIQYIFDIRNKAFLEQDKETLESLYNRNTKYGTWAFEHQTKKMKYLVNWADKQGVDFTSIKSKTVINWTKDKGSGATVNLTCSTEYKYVYQNEPDKENTLRIGTYHSLDLVRIGDEWLISREWYTDPFADSLNLENIKAEENKDFIISHESRDFSNLNERRIKAVEYADRYCGAAADEENGFSYNKKYKNYNSLGGDCTNFASQVLHEGGGFRKTGAWNYDKDGSRAWVNAQAFKDYMLYSGRASLIAHGTYDKVFKASYKLLPGDFIAYERKGKVVHISVVTDADSKGYSLVNSHNTDRYRVPWDLGWSDKNIKFWLVRVHY